MAYITCKKCGCQMSDKSEACPVCGTPVENLENAEAPMMPPPVPEQPADAEAPKENTPTEVQHQKVEPTQSLSYPTSEQTISPLQRYKKWIIIGGIIVVVLIVIAIVISITTKKKTSPAINESVAEVVQQAEQQISKGMPIIPIKYINVKDVRHYKKDADNIYKVSYDIYFPKEIPDGSTYIFANGVFREVYPHNVTELIRIHLADKSKYRSRDREEDAATYVKEVIQQKVFYTDAAIPYFGWLLNFGDKIDSAPEEDAYLQNVNVSLKENLYIPSQLLQMQLKTEYINEDFPNGVSSKYYTYDIAQSCMVDAMFLAIRQDDMQTMANIVAHKIYEKYYSGELARLDGQKLLLSLVDKVRFGEDRLYIDVTSALVFKDEYFLDDVDYTTIVEVPYKDYQNLWTDRMKVIFNLQ